MDRFGRLGAPSAIGIQMDRFGGLRTPSTPGVAFCTQRYPNGLAWRPESSIGSRCQILYSEVSKWIGVEVWELHWLSKWIGLEACELHQLQVSNSIFIGIQMDRSRALGAPSAIGIQMERFGGRRDPSASGVKFYTQRYPPIG